MYSRSNNDEYKCSISFPFKKQNYGSDKYIIDLSINKTHRISCILNDYNYSK